MGAGARRRALLGALACRVWEKKGEGRKRRREKKKKREKEKKEKKRERGKERADGAIRGGGRPRVRCAASAGSNTHVKWGKETERWDGDWYGCRNGGLPGKISGRQEFGQKKI